MDHVYSRSKCTSRSNVIIEDLSDHYLISTTYLNLQFAAKKIKITKKRLDDSSNTNLKIFLGAKDWANFGQLNLEQSTDHLIEGITEALDLVAPLKEKK